MDTQCVPVVDLGLGPALEPRATQPAISIENIAQQIEAAMRISGFFYIRNHGISPRVLEQLIAQTKLFFSAPLSVREAIGIDQNNRGFLATGESKMLGAKENDLKEVFFFGREIEPDDPDLLAGVALTAPNQWPSGLEQFRPAVLDYLQAAGEAGNIVLQAIAHMIGANDNFFEAHYDRPMARGQLNHYAAPGASATPDQFGVAPHTDFGAITLLYQHTPGLEVFARNEQWVAVPPIPDTLVVNIGDLLERWTNGQLPSTRHRVRNQTGSSRYSIAIFYDPSPTAVVNPAQLGFTESLFEPITAANYILSRSQRVFAQFDDSIRKTD
jgi:isopenicillin N synthase-like dioxygenase